MKTHIPGDNGQTLCNRVVGKVVPYGETAGGYWQIGQSHVPGVYVIDIARTPIDDATCALCHRVDNARQAAQYRDDLGWAMFTAACRWAGSRGVTGELRYSPSKCAAVLTYNKAGGWPGGLCRTREDLRLDAEEILAA